MNIQPLLCMLMSFFFIQMFGYHDPWRGLSQDPTRAVGGTELSEKLAVFSDPW
jgi:hypothetical protein